jgi:hypothetical protein
MLSRVAGVSDPAFPALIRRYALQEREPAGEIPTWSECDGGGNR